MRSISQTFSVIFNPLMIVTQLFWVLIFYYPAVFPFNSVNNGDWVLIHGGLLVFGTLVMPAISVGFLRMLGYISNYELSDRKERMVPFYFVTFWYCFSTYLFASKLQIGWHFIVILGITTLLIAVLTIITNWYKISIHCASICGAAGFLTVITTQNDHPMSVWPLVVVFALSGIVGSARLHVNAHSFDQVVYGSLFGFCFCFLGLLILW